MIWNLLLALFSLILSMLHPHPFQICVQHEEGMYELSMVPELKSEHSEVVLQLIQWTEMNNKVLFDYDCIVIQCVQEQNYVKIKLLLLNSRVHLGKNKDRQKYCNIYPFVKKNQS